MQSKAATVDVYFQEIPPERRPALTRLRGLCREILVGYDEGMAHGMPVYQRDGQGGIAFNSQKNYIALYVAEDVVDAHRDRLPRAGKCCVRFPNPATIDWSLVELLLKDTAASPARSGE